MAKYLYLLKIQISTVTAFRFEMATFWIHRCVITLVYFALWSLTTDDKESLMKLLLYFLLYYSFFEPLHTAKTGQYINKAIHNGEINSYLVKPIYFPAVQAIKSVTIMIIRCTSAAVILMALCIVSPEYFLPSSFINFILFLIFTMIGLVIWNLFLIVMGSIAFTGTEVSHTLSVTDLVLRFFKGGLVPAFLMPAGLLSVLCFTPIPYLAYFPIQLYQDGVESSELLKATIVSITWLIVMWALSKIVFTAGLKKYEATNG